MQLTLLLLPLQHHWSSSRARGFVDSNLFVSRAPPGTDLATMETELSGDVSCHGDSSGIRVLVPCVKSSKSVPVSSVLQVTQAGARTRGVYTSGTC